MKRSFLRALMAVALVAMAGLPTSAEAGLFKNLLQKVDTAMRNYNNNMWAGENSLGNTVIKAVKGEKGNFFQAFDAVHAAQMNAQNQALADLKEVWKAVKEIVMWLPNKLKEYAEKVIGKLDGMNQGATVKDRWNNLVGGGGGGGAGIQSFGGGGGSPPPIQAPPSGGGEESGAIQDDLSALLGDEPGALGSVDREALVQEYSLSARASADAPRAPTSGAEGYGELMEMSLSIDQEARRTEARRRVRFAYLGNLDAALRSGSLPLAAELLKNGKKLYVGNPDGMHKAMEMVAKRHPKHSVAIEKASRRLSNLAQSGR